MVAVLVIIKAPLIAGVSNQSIRKSENTCVPPGKAAREFYRGTSLIRKRPPPYDSHRALGMVLR